MSAENTLILVSKTCTFKENGMNQVVLFLTSFVCFGVAHATEWRPSKEFLVAVRMLESSNGQFTHGDNGESLGDFQLSEGAWLDVNDWRKARGLKTYQYQNAVHNGFINRTYAGNYLTILQAELRKKLRRAPTHAEIYAAYNLGLKTFGECNFKLDRVNPTTRAKCREIAERLDQRG
jgi:hypothetical protein